MFFLNNTTCRVFEKSGLEGDCPRSYLAEMVLFVARAVKQTANSAGRKARPQKEDAIHNSTSTLKAQDVSAGDAKGNRDLISKGEATKLI